LSDDTGGPAVDLGFIGQALQRLTTEVASLRDDMRVLTTVVMRSTIRKDEGSRSYEACTANSKRSAEG
jgi:hypothetical protein